MAQALRLRLLSDIHDGLLLADLAENLQVFRNRRGQKMEDFSTPTLGADQPSVVRIYFTTRGNSLGVFKGYYLPPVGKRGFPSLGLSILVINDGLVAAISR